MASYEMKFIISVQPSLKINVEMQIEPISEDINLEYKRISVSIL